MKLPHKTILFVVLILFAILITFFVVAGHLDSSPENIEEVSLPELVQQINDDQVSKINISRYEIVVTLKSSKIQKTKNETDRPLNEILYNLGVDNAKMNTVEVTVLEESRRTRYLETYLPIFLPPIILALFIMIVFYLAVYIFL